MKKPIKITGRGEKVKVIDLLAELATEHYSLKSDKKIWKAIHENAEIKFRNIDTPPNMPPNQEALQWIKLTGFRSNSCVEPELSSLIGKPIVLVYPNSD